jgi:DNA-binding transcriptional LysR family regulator
MIASNAIPEPMKALDLNLLAALDALLEHGSVVGAADALGVSPSAMSRTLARIRRQTGDPILARAGRGLVPTPRALAIRERVRAALEETRSLLGPSDERDARDIDRVLTVRADDSVSAMVGPGLIERLRRSAPGLTIVFRAEGEEDVASLRDGRVDLDIGVQGALGPEVRTRRIMDDERVVLARGPAPARRARMSLSRYARAEHVDVSRRGRRRGPVDDLLERHGLTRRVRTVVPNQLAAALLVAQSDVVSLVSARFARAMTPLLDVHAVAPPEPLGRVSISLAWHPRHDGDPAHAWLREQLVEIARSFTSRRRAAG